jgi:hypothetical protein
MNEMVEDLGMKVRKLNHNPISINRRDRDRDSDRDRDRDRDREVGKGEDDGGGAMMMGCTEESSLTYPYSYSEAVNRTPFSLSPRGGDSSSVGNVSYGGYISEASSSSRSSSRVGFEWPQQQQYHHQQQQQQQQKQQQQDSMHAMMQQSAQQLQYPMQYPVPASSDSSSGSGRGGGGDSAINTGCAGPRLAKDITHQDWFEQEGS